MLLCPPGIDNGRFGWTRRLAGWLCLALSGAELVKLATLTAWLTSRVLSVPLLKGSGGASWSSVGDTRQSRRV